jgi:glycosyltransferase involved in cell wall biosynthesis
MWARNGAATLPSVLGRVDECLPQEFVHRKIFVDDHSTDRSRAIAQQFNWEVYKNEEGGVAAGVNKAFSLVDCEYFASIEQDLLLNSSWWNRVSALLEKPNVAVAQGWRLPPEAQPVLRRFEEYRLQRYKRYSLPIFSIDNAMFRFSVVKSIGLVPSELKYSGVDTYIYKGVTSLGYRWSIDYDLVSTHLRQGGVREQINRYYRYGLDTPILERSKLSCDSKYVHQGLKSMVGIFLFSPFRGFLIAAAKRCPQIVVYYPLIRFAVLRGYLKSGA